MIIRFDDIYADNEVMNHAYDIMCILNHYIDDASFIYGVNISWFKDAEGQRVYPKALNPLSDWRCHYKVDNLGLPIVPKEVDVASHGLIHADHRLMDYGQQEMSILMSCNLLNAKMFIPPFNKWNETTELICQSNDIWLIKYENGWQSMEHNKFDIKHQKWYLHPRQFTTKEMEIYVREGIKLLQ